MEYAEQTQGDRAGDAVWYGEKVPGRNETEMGEIVEVTEMYEELVGRMRERADSLYNASRLYDSDAEDAAILYKAADAIEELSKQVELENQSGFADGQIAANRKKPRWIPVDERLPEDGVAVNIVWRNHSPVIYYQHIKDKPQTATGVYYHGRWYWWSAVVQDYLAEYGEWEPDKMDEAIEVTHWQPLPPLPEPPEEET